MHYRNMNDLISIIIPVFNVEEYLLECVNSVIAQTHKNLEILLIDDGSTDNSGRICDEIAVIDSRVKVTHKQNEGVSESRNTGIRMCKGDYIGFVDADDWIEPEMYQQLMDSMIENNADISTCGYIDYPKGPGHPIKKGIKSESPKRADEAVFPLLRRNGYFTSSCNKLFRRELVFQSGTPVLMDRNLFYGEDEEWLFRILQFCRLISFVPMAFYHWRPRKESFTRLEKITEKQLSLINAKQKMLTYIPQTDFVLAFARGHVYNDCHILKVWTYLASDKKSYNKVSCFLAPFRRPWFALKDITLSRRIKVCLLDGMMHIRAPKKVIRKISLVR